MAASLCVANATTWRHRDSGVSPAALEAKLKVPGAVLFKAQSDSHVVGMALWYVFGDVGYYHLGACSEAGYALRAFFGLFWRAIRPSPAQAFGCSVLEAVSASHNRAMTA